MHENLITKTDFVRYLECPLYAWLNKHRPELWENHEHGKRAMEGYEVEKLAHRLFEGGVEVEGNYEKAHKHTEDLMSTGCHVLYQATALTNRFLARADILVLDRESGEWDLFEVKSTNTPKKEHIADLCFQRAAFWEAGIPLKSINLVHLNKEYIFDSKKGLELDKLFLVENMTEEVQEAYNDYEGEVEKAYKVLTGTDEPQVKILKRSFKYEQPQAFLDYYYRDVPDYSIYDIDHIRQNHLEALADQGILKIEDVPADFFNGDRQNLQVWLTKEKTSKVDKEGIKEELESLKYPLYFLDYETINPAIPFLDKQSPHQQVPFQYSLHILDAQGGEVRHEEFLHTERSNPVPALAESLMGHIGETGTVIVWYKPFEMGRNEEIAERYPEYAHFMESVNKRVYDLMLIFKDKYMDYRFKGSMSIKKVLPVLVPELSYKELAVQNGGMATDTILDMIEGNGDVSLMAANLKKYCALDTYAMVRIFEVLNDRETSHPLSDLLHVSSSV